MKKNGDVAEKEWAPPKIFTCKNILTSRDAWWPVIENSICCRLFIAPYVSIFFQTGHPGRQAGRHTEANPHQQRHTAACSINLKLLFHVIFLATKQQQEQQLTQPPVSQPAAMVMVMVPVLLRYRTVFWRVVLSVRLACPHKHCRP